MLTCEILIPEKMAQRGFRMLREMHNAAGLVGISSRITNAYQGQSQWLMTYGPGAPDRLPAIQRHLAAGGRCILWDLGYWDRKHSLRVSIDTFHPQEWIWRKTLRDDRLNRFRAEIPFRNTYNAHGPIVFAAMGRKSQRVYGDWDTRKLAELNKLGRKIIYREKPVIAKTNTLPPIESVIDGASLVAAHHSNVAVDAIVAGIPFDCADGAALAFRGDREEFMRQLAWFQWRHDEAEEAWKFLRGMIQ